MYLLGLDEAGIMPAELGTKGAAGSMPLNRRAFVGPGSSPPTKVAGSVAGPSEKTSEGIHLLCFVLGVLPVFLHSCALIVCISSGRPGREVLSGLCWHIRWIVAARLWQSSRQ